MQISVENGIRVLRPDAGLKITNAERLFYSEEVWLGKHDSPESYVEVDAGEEGRKYTETDEDIDI